MMRNTLAILAITLAAAACGGDVADVDANTTDGGTFTCPSGQEFKNNKCTDVVDGGSSCPAGQHLENGRCVDDTNNSCPSGQHLENGRCVDNTNPSGSIVVHITGLQSVEQFKWEVVSDPSALGRTMQGGSSYSRSGSEITVSIPFSGTTPYLRFSCWTGTAWCASNYGSPTLNVSGNATWNGTTRNFQAISVRPNNAEVLVKFGDGNVPSPLQTN